MFLKSVRPVFDSHYSLSYDSASALILSHRERAEADMDKFRERSEQAADRARAREETATAHLEERERTYATRWQEADLRCVGQRRANPDNSGHVAPSIFHLREQTHTLGLASAHRIETPQIYVGTQRLFRLALSPCYSCARF